MTINSDQPTPRIGDRQFISTGRAFTTLSPFPIVTTTTTYVPYTSVPSSFSTSTSPRSTMTAVPSSSSVAVNNDGNDGNSGNTSSDGDNNNNTLVIVLSSVLSVVALVLIGGVVLLCVRRRRRRASLFSRAITPLDDDEIATWKVSRHEKEIDSERTSGGATLTGGGHGRHESANSVRKPPSVIVYPGPRRSEDQRSPRTPHMYSAYAKKSLEGKRSFDYGGKTSLDKELPQTPIQARAPNAREGLTDEAVPGDDPFVKRQQSRLSKAAPLHQLRNPHTRTKSARSSFSMRSFGEPFGLGYNSDVELTPRTSHEYHSSHGNPVPQAHSRVFSSSSIPPQIPLSDEVPVGGLSPRPLLRRDEIGRAIG